MRYLLALDQGTTSSRALILNERGEIVSMAQKEFEQHFPFPGYVEHDAEEIWTSQYAVAHEALAKAKLSGSQISGIGITNQRETCLIWDRKTGEPIAPAIVWQDRRTTAMCEEMKNRGLEKIFKQKTGLLLDPYFSASKLRWLLEHVPDAKEKAIRGELASGTIDSWLVWKLTSGQLHITDASNASRTLLFNIHTQMWDDELLELFDIPKSLLPFVRDSSEVYGETSLLGGSIPIAAIAGDQQAALFGQLCWERGSAKATFGTGCFLLLNTGSSPIVTHTPLLSTIAWRMGGTTTYALEGSVFVAGAAIQWLRDNLKFFHDSFQIDRLASSVPNSEGVVFVPAFTGLGAPHWDPHARGALFGLTRGTTQAHIARATLESIAFQSADLLRSMQEESQLTLSEFRVDGGVVASDLLLQLQADLIQIPVIRPKVRELTAMGAAFLAGLAVGVWPHREAIRSLWKLDKVFQPQERPSTTQWEKAIERVKGWAE